MTHVINNILNKLLLTDFSLVIRVQGNMFLIDGIDLIAYKSLKILNHIEKEINVCGGLTAHKLQGKTVHVHANKQSGHVDI